MNGKTLSNLYVSVQEASVGFFMQASKAVCVVWRVVQVVASHLAARVVGIPVATLK